MSVHLWRRLRGPLQGYTGGQKMSWPCLGVWFIFEGYTLGTHHAEARELGLDVRLSSSSSDSISNACMDYVVRTF